MVGARWSEGGVTPDLLEVPHEATTRRHACQHQPIPVGSYGKAPAPPFPTGKSFSFGLWVQSTTKTPRRATIMSLQGSGLDLTLGLNDSGHPTLSQNGMDRVVSNNPVRRGAWVVLSCEVAGANVTLRVCQPDGETQEHPGRIVPVDDADQVRFAARASAGWPEEFFDGRLADPLIALVDGQSLDQSLLAGPAAIAKLGSLRLAAWDFSRAMSPQAIIDTGPARCDGTLVNRPARAVTGPFWDGTAFDWRHAPHHYGAIHFHADDLDDCRWSDTICLDIPTDYKPGVYAAEILNGDGRDLIPFLVRCATGGEGPRLAILLPTFTYLSYGNANGAMRGPDFGAGPYRDEETLAAIPALGKSQYDLHDDRSPVMFSSPRRPLLTLRFGVRPWGLPVDAALLGFLNKLGLEYDVLADADLHNEGYRALYRYGCLITGNHPEYYSSEMLDALEAFTHRGGRLMYLGGNGFYWRVSVCPDVGTIEVRRAEDGTRAWIAPPGEAHHAMDGGYGGLWRRLGRAPNRLVDVGFAAQGDFERSGYYEVNDRARSGPAGFVLHGVAHERIGDFGWLGGGAAGQEIDRADHALGTSEDTIVIATSTGHGQAMMRTIEEMLSNVPPFSDPKARSDITFRAVSGGGAIFSVGSMTWIAALDHNGYDNDVARITGNVIRRFLDPSGFEGQADG